LIVPYTNFTEIVTLERPVDTWLKNQEPGSAIVEYPWSGRSKLALYSQTIHGQPIVNGYAPHQPQFLAEEPGISQNRPTQKGVKTLAEWGVRYLLLTRPDIESGQDEILSTLMAYEQLCLVRSFSLGEGNGDGRTHVFQVMAGTESCP
jgi:hypothetical protein